MKTRQTTQATTRREPEPPYRVHLTPKGEQYVAEHAARRTLAKLAVAAEAMLDAERMAGNFSQRASSCDARVPGTSHH